jgi:hypothetical protein
MTNYVVFIHGVNTRDVRDTPHYADSLFKNLQAEIGDTLELKSIPLYWGDINEPAEKDLLREYQASQVWEKLFFRRLREKQILQFTGDGALYISPSTGSVVVESLKKQLERELSGYKPEDRLHLVTHSMGTVILFDVLFSQRWDYNPTSQSYKDAEDIRDLLFGLPPHEDRGIRLGSISTMGSPIGIYSLMMHSARNSQTSHDITKHLQNMLEILHTEGGSRLPWRNFIHPADIIAHPLEKLLPTMIDPAGESLDIEDILTVPSAECGSTINDGNIASFNQLLHHLLGSIVLQSEGGMDITDALIKAANVVELAKMVLATGHAHGSYWRSQAVVCEIATMIKTVIQPAERVPATS